MSGWTTETERDRRRMALAGEIAELVLQDGLDDMGLRGLAARLGTSDRMLLYYFGSKDRLVEEALGQVSVRLAMLLAAHGGRDRVSPGRFLAEVLALTGDPEVAPFNRLWTEVIARGARGERPYDRIGAKAVQSWMEWIDSRLAPSVGGAEPGRAAALLSIVEGVTLLEVVAPGCTTAVGAYLSRALDADGAGHGLLAKPVERASRIRTP